MLLRTACPMKLGEIIFQRVFFSGDTKVNGFCNPFLMHDPQFMLSSCLHGAHLLLKLKPYPCLHFP